MARDKMTIHSEWLDAVAALPEEMQGRAMMAIVRYGLTGEMTAEDGFISAILAFIKPTIDIDNTRYDNGCKGGRPKGKTETETKPNKNRNKTEQKPKHNRTETETKPNGNYGFLGGIIGGSTSTTIRDNNFNTDDVVVDDLCARLRDETIWVEAVCMNLRKDPEYIHRRLEEFCTEQKVQGVTAKSLGDAKRHFRYWLRKVEQIEAEQSRRGEPTTNGRPYPIFTYEEMLAEIGRKGGSTNDYATLYMGSNTKPMWVRMADKKKYDIPHQIAS
jgi:hypothetical protein